MADPSKCKRLPCNMNRLLGGFTCGNGPDCLSITQRLRAMSPLQRPGSSVTRTRLLHGTGVHRSMGPDPESGGFTAPLRRNAHLPAAQCREDTAPHLRAAKVPFPNRRRAVSGFRSRVCGSSTVPLCNGEHGPIARSCRHTAPGGRAVTATSHDRRHFFHGSVSREWGFNSTASP